MGNRRGCLLYSVWSHLRLLYKFIRLFHLHHFSSLLFAKHDRSFRFTATIHRSLLLLNSKENKELAVIYLKELSATDFIKADSMYAMILWKFQYLWIMEKSLKIVRLKDTSTDYLYWMSRTEIERLEAIEILRQQYINYKKDVQPRLQRVCRVVNQKWNWILGCGRLCGPYPRTPGTRAI